MADHIPRIEDLPELWGREAPARIILSRHETGQIVGEAILMARADQQAWYYDLGQRAGSYHTYDRLCLGGEDQGARKIHVLIPREHGLTRCRYPVVFMNDGETAFFPGGPAGLSWDVPQALGRLYEERAIRELIVVAIGAVDRDREYTHAPWGRGAYGGLEQYAAYVTDHLKPFIDAHYQTELGRGSTMILGSSHGGLAAFYIACRRPEAFRFAAALSPSFWVGVDRSNAFPHIEPMPTPLRDSSLISRVHPTLADARRRPKLYLDWGLIRAHGPHNASIEERATARGREMVDLLQRDYGYVLGEELFAREDPRGDHTERSWARRVSAVLELFAAPSQEVA
jgi:enterochelin esterase-like enzyme